MSNDRIEARDGKAIAYVGPKAVNVFRAKVVAGALRLYAATGIKANRMYTPKNMLAAASQMTGKTYKRGQYEQAAADLTALADNANVPVVRV
jgi:cell division protein FtsN